MSRELKQISRVLQAERCPENVIQRVQETIARERRPRTAATALVAAAAILVLGWIAIDAFTPSPAPGPATVTAPSADAVRQQTQLALAIIGHTLVRAGDQSSDLILQASVPPIRDSLTKARHAILPAGVFFETEHPANPKPNKL